MSTKAGLVIGVWDNLDCEGPISMNKLLVLQQWGDPDYDEWLVVPLTSENGPMLHTEVEIPGTSDTVQAWNTRTVLGGLWLEPPELYSLTDRELADCQALFRHAATGEELPAHMREWVGPEVTRKNGPAIRKYQREETARWSEILRGHLVG